MIALTGITAVLSAFLDNLTTILLMVPITFLLADTLDIPPVPLIVMEIITSNIGGTATLIGDPPNIIIAGATGLTFNEFIVNLAPIAFLTLVVVVGLLYLFYRSELQIAPEKRRRVMEIDPRRSIEDADELRRTLPVLVLTILAFFVHQQLGLEPATVALTGAAVMLAVSRNTVEEALAGVEWATLLFFAGLFVMVGALEETGAIKEVADGIASLTAGDRTAELLGIAWASAIGSACRGQHPFHRDDDPRGRAAAGRRRRRRRLLVGPRPGGVLRRQRHDHRRGRQRGGLRAGRPCGHPISFMYFLKVGLPVTFVSMLMATAYIAVRYL